MRSMYPGLFFSFSSVAFLTSGYSSSTNRMTSSKSSIAFRMSGCMRLTFKIVTM